MIGCTASGIGSPAVPAWSLIRTSRRPRSPGSSITSPSRPRAERGELTAGTVDTLVIWHLTGGRQHLTDVTNASRTLLMDLETGQYSDSLCEAFAVPPGLLPSIRPAREILVSLAGWTIFPTAFRSPEWPVIGKQASLVGQGCLEPGHAKCTYGTGEIPAGPHRFQDRPLGSGIDHDPGRLTGRRALRSMPWRAACSSPGAACQRFRDGLKAIGAEPLNRRSRPPGES